MSSLSSSPTGANTGLGFRIVRALCGSNTAYDVIVGGRSPTKVEEAIASTTAEFASTGSKLYPLQVDIEHDDSIHKAFDEVQSKFGRVDALVNNAGMHVNTSLDAPQADQVIIGVQLDQKLAAGEMTKREIWNQSWNTNVAGAHIMTSTFIPLLRQRFEPTPDVHCFWNLHTCRNREHGVGCKQTPSQRLAQKHFRRSRVSQQ